MVESIDPSLGMSTLAPKLAVKDPRIGEGGGTPPSFGGGGNGNGEGGSFDYGERLRRARLGLVLGLTAVIMLFVGFTSALLVSSITMELARRGIARKAALAPVSAIPGVSLGEEKSFPWLGITVVLGMGFLVGQFLVWRILHDRHVFENTGPSSSFAYLLFGTHAVHLAGGVIAL